MVYKYISKKFAGSLTKLRGEFSKLQENGGVLQAGEEFNRPILPAMRPVITTSVAQPAARNQSLKKIRTQKR